MSRYIETAEFVEGMNVFFGPEVEPLTHRIWYGDFMALCKHNVACPVCFDAHAIHTADVTPGSRTPTTFQPCWDCQAKGYRVMRKPWWARLFQRVSASSRPNPMDTPPPEPQEQAS